MTLGRKVNAGILLLLGAGLFVTPSWGETYTGGHRDNEKRQLRSSIDHDSRIVGGSLAPQGRFPSIVGLFDSDGLFKCGGTLILPDVVLCAAHCTALVTKAEVGRFDLSMPLALEGAEKFQLIIKIDHPDYGANTTYSNDMDIALYKLGNGGTLKVKSVAINGDPSVPAPGDTITVAGWGATSEGGSGSYKLKKVDVNYMRNQKCQSTYTGYDGYITEDMFCANVIGGGKVCVV
jgi:trypsin